jgi:hypothetical protein
VDTSALEWLTARGLAATTLTHQRIMRTNWQRITRWAFAAVGAVMLITVGTVGYLLWDKAHQLAAKQVELNHAQANLLGELSEAKRLATMPH